jgi:hypothetical protein
MGDIPNLFLNEYKDLARFDSPFPSPFFLCSETNIAAVSGTEGEGDS